jgi:hypothetical protein
MKITREELLDMHDTICSDAKAIMQDKNADYGAGEDALRNFRLCENMMIPIEVGIVTRLGDKLARISKIVVTGDTVVKNETVNDTILDAINYLVILAAAIEERRRNTPKPMPSDTVPPAGMVADLKAKVKYA